MATQTLSLAGLCVCVEGVIGVLSWTPRPRDPREWLSPRCSTWAGFPGDSGHAGLLTTIPLPSGPRHSPRADAPVPGGRNAALYLHSFAYTLLALSRPYALLFTNASRSPQPPGDPRSSILEGKEAQRGCDGPGDPVSSRIQTSCLAPGRDSLGSGTFFPRKQQWPPCLRTWSKQVVLGSRGGRGEPLGTSPYPFPGWASLPTSVSAHLAPPKPSSKAPSPTLLLPSLGPVASGPQLVFLTSLWVLLTHRASCQRV